MINPNPVAAKALESHAANIAATACNKFIEEQPELRAQASLDVYESWSNHFQQRVMELSAAVAAGKPELFTTRVEWSRQAMSARFIEDADLEDSLRQLRSVVSQLLPPDSCAEALVCLDAAISSHSEELPRPEASQLDPADPMQRLALFYLQSALEGNTLEAMQTITDAIDEGLDPRAAILDVVLAAQREVGHLWHLDQITIAEEHLVTSTTQRLMPVIAARATRAPDRGKTAVTASVAGNAHDIGIRAIAYLLELDGWRTIHLGPDLPRDNLPAAIHFFDADIVLLSLTLNSHLARLNDAIQEIRGTADSDVKIMVGGNAFRDAPLAWKTMGADGFATGGEQAVLMAQQLVSGPVTH